MNNFTLVLYDHVSPEEIVFIIVFPKETPLHRIAAQVKLYDRDGMISTLYFGIPVFLMSSIELSILN